MEYKLDKTKLANDPLYETLTALQKSMEQLNLQLYVVGAWLGKVMSDSISTGAIHFNCSLLTMSWMSATVRRCYMSNPQNHVVYVIWIH